MNRSTPPTEIESLLPDLTVTQLSGEHEQVVLKPTETAILLGATALENNALLVAIFNAPMSDELTATQLNQRIMQSAGNPKDLSVNRGHYPLLARGLARPPYNLFTVSDRPRRYAVQPKGYFLGRSIAGHHFDFRDVHGVSPKAYYGEAKLSDNQPQPNIITRIKILQQLRHLGTASTRQLQIALEGTATYRIIYEHCRRLVQAKIASSSDSGRASDNNSYFLLAEHHAAIDHLIDIYEQLVQLNPDFLAKGHAIADRTIHTPSAVESLLRVSQVESTHAKTNQINHRQFIDQAAAVVNDLGSPVTFDELCELLEVPALSPLQRERLIRKLRHDRTRFRAAQRDGSDYFSSPKAKLPKRQNSIDTPV